MSGAQRVHDADLLVERATELGVPLETIKDYIASFKYAYFIDGLFPSPLARFPMHAAAVVRWRARWHISRCSVFRADMCAFGRGGVQIGLVKTLVSGTARSRTPAAASAWSGSRCCSSGCRTSARLRCSRATPTATPPERAPPGPRLGVSCLQWESGPLSRIQPPAPPRPVNPRCASKVRKGNGNASGNAHVGRSGGHPRGTLYTAVRYVRRNGAVIMPVRLGRIKKNKKL